MQTEIDVIETLKWTTTEVEISEINPAVYNPRVKFKEDSKEWKDLVKSIDKFGVADPLIVNKDMTLIGGHFRLRVLKSRGDKTVEVRMPPRNLTKREEMELNIRLNYNHGRFSNDLLTFIPSDTLKDVGFSDRELKKLDEFRLKDLDISVENFNEGKDVETDVTQLVEDRLVRFPSEPVYGIPCLRDDMIFDFDEWGAIEELKTYTHKTVYLPDDKALVLYHLRNSYKGEKKNGIMSFYIYDNLFDNVWFETPAKVKEFKRQGWAAVMTPNWSLYYGDPLAMQVWSTFKSRYVGRYMQESGIKIIPDVCVTDEKSYTFCLNGIPDLKVSYGEGSASGRPSPFFAIL